MAIDPERKAALQRARAIGLLRTCFDLEPSRVEIIDAPFGVAARSGEDRAWIVSMSDDLAVLGGLLVWADRHRPRHVDLVVDHHGGVHSRRAALLAPELRVWQTDGERVVEATAAPLPEPPPPPRRADREESILREAGLEIVCEDGIVRGELAGLEVGRILHGPDGPVLEVGVGRFDREAGALLHAGRDPSTALAAALDLVGPHRRAGAPGHPVGRLERPRWLRRQVTEDPSLAGVVDPQLVEPIPPRSSLLEGRPAALLGADGDRRVLVVCTAGVDLGLVPDIADLILRHAPDEVRVLMPARDRLDAVEALGARLPLPVAFRAVTPPWVTSAG